jgi:hypothetical protein
VAGIAPCLVLLLLFGCACGSFSHWVFNAPCKDFALIFFVQLFGEFFYLISVLFCFLVLGGFIFFFFLVSEGREECKAGTRLTRVFGLIDIGLLFKDNATPFIVSSLFFPLLFGLF